jgi:hypothetical protein
MAPSVLISAPRSAVADHEHVQREALVEIALGHAIE